MSDEQLENAPPNIMRQEAPPRAVRAFFSILALTIVLVLTAVIASIHADDAEPIFAASLLAALSVLAGLATVVAARTGSRRVARRVAVGIVITSTTAAVLLYLNLGDRLGVADWIGATGFFAASFLPMLFDRSFGR